MNKRVGPQSLLPTAGRTEPVVYVMFEAPTSSGMPSANAAVQAEEMVVLRVAAKSPPSAIPAGQPVMALASASSSSHRTIASNAGAACEEPIFYVGTERPATRPPVRSLDPAEATTASERQLSVRAVRVAKDVRPPLPGGSGEAFSARVGRLLRETRVPNWDGEGAHPVPMASWMRALAVYRDIKKILGPEAEPFPSPCADGSVHLAWSHHGKRLLIEAYPTRYEFSVRGLDGSRQYFEPTAVREEVTRFIREQLS